ncbi:MAG: hypothetical protein EXR47_05075 [Dehalococcoidia bacterium]|nr:hypothetical protein [Dehalococcoidia bacterium]
MQTSPEPGTTHSVLQLRRRAFHILVTAAMPAVSLFMPRWVVLALASAAFVISVSVETARLQFPGLNRWLLESFGFLFKERERGRVTAAMWLALATLLAFLVFPEPLAAVALLMSAFGDPAASVVGRLWGRLRFGAKSVEGAAAFFAAALAVAVVCWAGRLYEPLWAGVAAAAVAAVVEALSGQVLPLEDNLTVPLAAGAVLALTTAI